MICSDKEYDTPPGGHASGPGCCGKRSSFVPLSILAEMSSTSTADSAFATPSDSSSTGDDSDVDRSLAEYDDDEGMLDGDAPEIVYVCWKVKKIPKWYRCKVQPGGLEVVCLDSDDVNTYKLDRTKDTWRSEAAYLEEVKGGIHVETPLEKWLRDVHKKQEKNKLLAKKGPLPPRTWENEKKNVWSQIVPFYKKGHFCRTLGHTFIEQASTPRKGARVEPLLKHVHRHIIANSQAASYSERDVNCILRHCTNFGIPVIVTMLFRKTKRVFESQEEYEKEFNACVQRVVEYAGQTKHQTFLFPSDSTSFYTDPASDLYIKIDGMINCDKFEKKFGVKLTLDDFGKTLQLMLPGLGDITKMSGIPLREAMKIIESLKWACFVRPKTAFLLMEEGRERELARFGEANVKAAADRAVPPGLGWFGDSGECFHEGCNKKAIGKGRCSAHGGGRKKCESDGCMKGSMPGRVKGRRCFEHGGGYVCASAKSCDKRATKKGGVCWDHGESKEWI